jgi:hypothetical protein
MKVDIWQQTHLTVFMSNMMRHFIGKYQEGHDVAVEDIEKAEADKDEQALKAAQDMARTYEVLTYLAFKAERGMKAGNTFTQAIWGIDTSVPISHSWCIVHQAEYGPMLQGFGVRIGQDMADFLLKPDGSFEGFALYGINDARAEISQLIDLAPLERKHWFYLYNILTGQEERIYYGHTVKEF